MRAILFSRPSGTPFFFFHLFPAPQAPGYSQLSLRDSSGGLLKRLLKKYPLLFRRPSFIIAATAVRRKNDADGNDQRQQVAARLRQARRRRRARPRAAFERAPRRDRAHLPLEALRAARDHRRPPRADDRGRAPPAALPLAPGRAPTLRVAPR